MSELALSTVFDSSAISRATYHPGDRTLDVWYKGGDRYSYFGVPEEIYRGLCEAESAGEFVNLYVKPFPHEIEPRRRRFRPD